MLFIIIMDKNLIEAVVLIATFIILSFGENKANFCYFIKIAIFAIILYLVMLFRRSDEHFQMCYPDSIPTPALVSIYSKTKATCMDKSAENMLPSDTSDDLGGDVVASSSCPMPMDKRITAEKSEKTKLKGMCRLPPDYERY